MTNPTITDRWEHRILDVVSTLRINHLTESNSGTAGVGISILGGFHTVEKMHTENLDDGSHPRFLLSRQSLFLLQRLSYSMSEQAVCGIMIISWKSIVHSADRKSCKARIPGGIRNEYVSCKPKS